MASEHDWFVATALTVRDRIVDRWFPSTWTIYRLPDATPLLTGPATATVTNLGHTSIRAVVAAPGR